MVPGELVGGAENKVHQLDWGVGHAEPVGFLFHSFGEERFVEFQQDFEAAFGVGDLPDPFAHAVVEALETVGVGSDVVSIQRVHHLVQRSYHRVERSELGGAEQGVKHGQRDYMAGQHVYQVGFF